MRAQTARVIRCNARRQGRNSKPAFRPRAREFRQAVSKKARQKQGSQRKKSTTKNLPPTSPVEIIGNPAPSTPGALVAAAATTQDSLVYWWFAPLLLAVVGSVGAVTARHYRKGEWDIVEEIEESS